MPNRCYFVVHQALFLGFFFLIIPGEWVGGWTHDGREMMLEKSVCPVCRVGSYKRCAVSGCGVGCQFVQFAMVEVTRGAQFLAAVLQYKGLGRFRLRERCTVSGRADGDRSFAKRWITFCSVRAGDLKVTV